MEKQAYAFGWLKEDRLADCWRWLWNGLCEYLTDHGERPWRPALWAVGIVLLFACVFLAT